MSTCTVNGYVRQITGGTQATSIRFVSLTRPVVVDNLAVMEPSEVVVRTNAVGFFTTPLAYGDYEVFVGAAKLTIEVPNDGATYNITALVVSAGLYEPALASGSVPDASASVPGKVLVDTNVASPVAATGFFYVATAAAGDWLTAIRAVPNKSNNKAVLIRKAAGEDRPAIMTWDQSSTATDDGYSVVKPADTDSGTAGRWVQHI